MAQTTAIGTAQNARPVQMSPTDPSAGANPREAEDVDDIAVSVPANSPGSCDTPDR